MTYIKVRVGEPVDKALRKLKKQLDKEGTIKTIKNNRYYDKPSEKKRKKSKNAKKRAKTAIRRRGFKF